MGQARSRPPLRAPLPAKQERSRKTRDALLAAGWKLLASRSWDEITVGDIVKAAGYSVGSFYTRFADKDAFFDGLAAEWIERSRARREAMYARLTPRHDFVAELILDSYRALLAHQHFWRAALVRGAASAAFWKPFRELGLQLIERALELRRLALGRELREDEARHLRFAFQMANGLINNSLVNRPGPIQPGTPEFESELVRGLKAVAGIDHS